MLQLIYKVWQGLWMGNKGKHKAIQSTPQMSIMANIVRLALAHHIRIDDIAQSKQYKVNGYYKLDINNTPGHK